MPNAKVEGDDASDGAGMGFTAMKKKKKVCLSPQGRDRVTNPAPSPTRIVSSYGVEGSALVSPGCPASPRFGKLPWALVQWNGQGSAQGGGSPSETQSEMIVQDFQEQQQT